MKPSLLICGCVITYLLTMPVGCVDALAEPPEEQPKTVTIPLDQIRCGSSGSRQLRGLEPEFFVYRDTPEKIAKYSTPEGLQEIEKIKQRAAEKSLVYAIERAMQAMPAGKNAQAGPGFAVEGRDRAALPGIYDVLVKGEKPRKTLLSGSDVSVVFFTIPVQPAVRLDHVERTGNVVEIRYMLVSHGHPDVAWNLALIPLGKLPPGEYRVGMIRSSEKEPDRDFFPRLPPGVEKSIVCKPFSFVVREQP